MSWRAVIARPYSQGSLGGNVINRSVCFRNSMFHNVCDAESSELQGLACLCCNADGTLRFKNLPELVGTDG